MEVAAVLQDVADDAAQESDVRARAGWHVDVGDRAGAGEARVDVNDLRPAAFRFHHPLKANRVVFGHVGAFDQDTVRVAADPARNAVAPAPSEEAPRPGTVEECQIRA